MVYISKLGFQKKKGLNFKGRKKKNPRPDFFFQKISETYGTKIKPPYVRIRYSKVKKHCVLKKFQLNICIEFHVITKDVKCGIFEQSAFLFKMNSLFNKPPIRLLTNNFKMYRRNHLKFLDDGIKSFQSHFVSNLVSNFTL